MKVAVLGGTGKMAGAVALHLSRTQEVIVGSRDVEKARAAAARIHGASGATSLDACRAGDAAIFGLPYEAMASAAELKEALAGKLVVSMVNPLKLEGEMIVYALDEGSAAEELQAILPKSRVATAFNNVPVSMMKKSEVPPMDILVAARDMETFEETAALVRCIPNLRPLHAGPLSEAQVVERITALVFNLARLNGTGSLATRFASLKEVQPSGPKQAA